jgi:hypothetical protein
LQLPLLLFPDPSGFLYSGLGFTFVGGLLLDLRWSPSQETITISSTLIRKIRIVWQRSRSIISQSTEDTETSDWTGTRDAKNSLGRLLSVLDSRLELF